jgi:chemosensory pili system protein ChpA (sensor histidine kinase/response regulator)
MSNKDNIDFSTLTWVKSELDETLNRAKEALMAYIEEPEDTNQLQFCITYLHQIQGTLKMVELYGAAMVAEEMEAVAKALMDDTIDDKDAAFDVLLRSILQLPDYLERIELGHKDVPIVLLPLVNDLRAVRSQRLLSESALFNPDLNLGVPEHIQDQDIALQGNQLKTALMKLRSAYQMALLKWIKHEQTEQVINQLQQILSKLRMILPQTDFKQLFWVYSGLLDGLASNRLKDSFAIKSLAAKVDVFIKDMAQNDSQVKSTGRALTRNFLYYIALGEAGTEKVDAIKNYFHLDQFIPDEAEIKHAEGSLSGKNKELLQTVSSAIQDDILVVQESLDLFIRNQSAQLEELSPLLGNLQKIADTLGILGLGVSRDEVLAHQNELKQFIDDNERPKDAVLLDVAQTLLRIESDLGDHIQSLGITTDSEDNQEHRIPRSEQKQIVKQLAKESIVNLQQVKANFVAFIEAPWDKHQVEDNPLLLKQIAGALNILDLTQAGEYIQQIISYVDHEILTKAAKPSAAELEQLATVVSSIEYYLENLDQGNRIRENLLSEVGRQIDTLQQQVSQDDRAVETIEETDLVEQEKSAETDIKDDEQSIDVQEDNTQSEDSSTSDVNDQVQVAEADQAENKDSDNKIVTFGEDADDFIKEVFVEEFEEELPNLQSEHQAWQVDPENNEQSLTEVRRIFHTLKGSGRLVGAEVIGEFGWKLENMCNRALDGAITYNDNFKSVLASGIDLAQELLTALKARATVPAAYPVVLQNADNVADGSEHLIALDDISQPEDLSAEESDLDSVFAEDTTSEDTSEVSASEEVAADEEFLESAATEEAEDLTTDAQGSENQSDSKDDLDDIDKPIEYEPPTDELNRLAKEQSDDSALFEDTDESSLQEDEKNELSLDEDEADELSLDEDETDDLSLDEDETDDLSLDEDEDLTDTEEDSFDFADTDSLEAELASLDEDDANEVTQPESEDGEVLSEDEAEEDSIEEDEDWEHDTAFIQILQKEVGSHLDDMDDQLNHYRDGSDEAVNDDFVRTVHTLNGAASMANVKAITDMTTPLEKLALHLHDLGQQFNDQDIEKIDALIQHTKGQLASLGSGEMLNDESISVYFKDRIESISDGGTETAAEDVLLNKALSDEDVVELDIDQSEDAFIQDDVDASDIDFDDFEVDGLNLDEAETDEAETDEAETDEAETDEAETDEAETDEAETDEAETDEAETDEAETDEVETDEVETDKVETDEVETDEVETDEVETDEVETDEVETDEVETDEVDSGDIFDGEVDEELLEIFSEEATEIFDRAEHLMAELEEKPGEVSTVQALQRDLHTLKGGARMAGLNQIGDLSHQLESLLESIAGKQSEVDAKQFRVISTTMDQLHDMVAADDYGQLTAIEEATDSIEKLLSSEGEQVKEESELDQSFFDPLNRTEEDSETTLSDEGDKSDSPQRPAKKSNVLAGGQIKVNSELLDKLVNFAGEVSIYRSRMEQQSAELRLNIDELENTVERVRRQLRDLEHETEAQIISNYQIQGEELEEDFDPLELDQFSTIQQLSRSLSESVSDLTNIQNYLKESVRSSETLLIQQSRVNTELQEGLMETRLVTFNSLVPRLRRVLRTASQELNKNAKLIIHGSEGEMDKTVLEGIQAPLEHMIRNAVVHGLEQDRDAANKPEQGEIEIDISREATEVVITVQDDGAGIDVDAVRSKALKRGLIEKGESYSDNDIAQLITHSGLSAADTVTKLAGRGVGMDVVNNEIKRLGGSLEISSTAGQGSLFTIRLPYTLALTQALIVQVADHRYAIPASGVEGLVRMTVDEFKRRLEDNDLNYDYAGEQYQIQELNKLLNVDSEIIAEGNQVPLVMIKSGDQGVALRVDQTFGGREIVVKSVGIQVASVPGIFGATILGDGAVVLILDIIPMQRDYMQKLERLKAEGIDMHETQEEEDVTTIMVVDDSITMRRAGERILTRNDFEVMTAKDGLDALNKLQEQVPDLMLLDIEMPRMDGYELATNMKQSDKFKDIPIIMITSRTGQKHKDRAMAIGVDRYLGKPYQELELLENIKELLNLEDV